SQHVFFFSSRRRHTRSKRDWSSDVCSSDLKTSLSSMFEAVGSYAAGTMSLEDVEEFEAKACPTCGSCSGMYTANSMNCLTEVLEIGRASCRERVWCWGGGGDIGWSTRGMGR